MAIQIPHEVGKEVGYTRSMVNKINRGAARPGTEKCKAIIRAMKRRGLKISLFDLRPDLKEAMMESL